MRQCRKCKNDFPETKENFRLRKSGKPWGTVCRLCKNTMARAWRRNRIAADPEYRKQHNAKTRRLRKKKMVGLFADLRKRRTA